MLTKQLVLFVLEKMRTTIYASNSHYMNKVSDRFVLVSCHLEALAYTGKVKGKLFLIRLINIVQSLEL
jgi:hypothetical protein